MCQQGPCGTQKEPKKCARELQERRTEDDWGGHGVDEVQVEPRSQQVGPRSQQVDPRPQQVNPTSQQLGPRSPQVDFKISTNSIWNSYVQ